MKRSQWIQAACATAIAAAMIAAAIVILQHDSILASTGDLSEARRRALDLIVEMDKLIISAALALIGGLATFTMAINRRSHYPPRVRLAIALSFGAAVYSIYFGYALYSRVIELLAAQAFDPIAAALQRIEAAQYYSFLFGLGLFCIVVWSLKLEGPR
jgi:hypothetical protein